MPVLKKSDFTFKTQPLKHQLDALCQSATKQNFAYLMEMGCVDGDTEFLSNRGWVKFKDFKLRQWEEPLYVGQVSDASPYQPDYYKVFNFVKPTSYIKKEVDRTFHFTGSVPRNKVQCVDMVLSPEHNTLCKLVSKDSSYLTPRESDITAFDLYSHLSTRSKSEPNFSGDRAHILQRTWIEGSPIGTDAKENADNSHTSSLMNYSYKALASLTEWEMRVQVAIMADGNFPKKSSDKCVLELRKPEKIKRFEMLCKKAKIVTAKEPCRDGKATRFHLIAPVHKKIYDEDFWMLPVELHRTIFNEVFYWDGSMEKTYNRFYTIHKKSADFIQFLTATGGYRASILKSTSNGAPYYTVAYNPEKKLGLDTEDSPYSTVFKCEEINKPQTVYCFRVPSGALLLRRNDKIFVTGNSGKTKVIIDNMAYLKKREAIRAVIVMAPKGVYLNWSTQEIPKHMPDEANAEVLVWRADASKGYKLRLKEQIENWDGKTLPILIFNIESLISKEGTETLELFMKKHKGMLMGVIDESTCIKNHRAKRTKAALAVGAKCRVKRIATGSPITNSPLDLYSQFAFLDKQILGCGSYYAFRNVFANIERITTRTGQSFEKVLSYKNLPLLSKRIQDFSYRITKKECLDLPNKIYVTRDVELTPEQKRLYKEMKNLSFAVHNEEIMSVQVALTKILRLHQILCGSFTSDEGEVIKVPNYRLTALEEVLDETGGKVIIWANYLQNIKDIQELLEKKYGKESFVTYIGETSSDDRVDAINLFQNANSPVRFFLGNVQTAGRGITLTAANTVIYYSNNYSLEMRQQSEDRAHRVGQDKPVTYVDLVARASLDEKIIGALLSKRNIANEILHDDLEDWIQL